jgi:dolichol-phosphate mannosyltransferase
MIVEVVIAAWDEKDNLLELNKRIINTLEKINAQFVIRYVLRGTKEQSGYNALNKLSKTDNAVRPIYADDVHGYGPSYKLGFSKVSDISDYVITMDADLNHSPEEIPRLIGSEADIVIGAREKDYNVGPGWKRFLSKTLNKIMSIMWGLDIKDKTSGFRVYKTRALKKIYDKPKAVGFEYLPELLICAKKEGLSFEERPITFKPRIRGESKMNIKKTAIGYLKLFWRYK